MSNNFIGIALGGRKGSGKDTVLDYLKLTRDVEVVRCKQPIVDEYLRLRNVIHDYTGWPTPPRDMSRTDSEYVKARDDADLIWFSSNVIRDPKFGDPQICSKYLRFHVPGCILPVIPDMRRYEENQTLFADLAEIGNPMLCMKLEAPMEVLMQRTSDRDGDLRNWHPDDPTENEIDNLKYHYIIDNSKNELRPLVLQLETILSRHPLLRRTKGFSKIGKQARIIDPTEQGYFWAVGTIVEPPEDEAGAGSFVWLTIEGRIDKRRYLRTQLIEANGGCF